MRLTKQREIILEELRKTEEHPTADELYLKVKKRLPRVSLGSVYRNLETLAGNGMILKLNSDDGRKHFDGNNSGHYHFHCTRCGAVRDLDFPGMPEIKKKLDKIIATMPELTECRLEFGGLCDACRNGLLNKKNKEE